ncbi:MAG: UspA protein [Pedosphaera sp.]|nr:UspA protein [Pedosphaera sp.]
MQSWWLASAGKSLALLLAPGPAAKISKPAAPGFRSNFTRQPGEPLYTGGWSNQGGNGPANILVPIDFTASSLWAVDCALQIAQRKNAQITLLHAISLNLSPYGPANVQLIKREMHQTAAVQLSRIAKVAKEENITAEYVIEEGRPSAVIEDYTQHHPVDLVILALHKHRGLSWLRGRKTAEKVIRHTHCPVLVLNP